MRWTIGAAAGLASWMVVASGCGERKAAPSPVAAVAAADAAVAAVAAAPRDAAAGGRDATTAAASPVPRPANAGPGATSVASLPREHWPCRYTTTLLGDMPGEWRFTYAGPASCRIPAVLQASGVVGCPTSVAYTNLELRLSTGVDYVYDAQGRLVVQHGPNSAERGLSGRGRRFALSYRAGQPASGGGGRRR